MSMGQKLLMAVLSGLLVSAMVLSAWTTTGYRTQKDVLRAENTALRTEIEEWRTVEWEARKQVVEIGSMCLGTALPVPPKKRTPREW